MIGAVKQAIEGYKALKMLKAKKKAIQKQKDAERRKAAQEDRKAFKREHKEFKKELKASPRKPCCRHQGAVRVSAPDYRLKGASNGANILLGCLGGGDGSGGDGGGGGCDGGGGGCDGGGGGGCWSRLIAWMSPL